MRTTGLTTLPVRMQRVQAETFRETPSTTERTVFKFRFHFRFVLLFAWLTRWPLIGVFAATQVIGPLFVHGIASRTLAGLARVAEK